MVDDLIKMKKISAKKEYLLNTASDAQGMAFTLSREEHPS